MIGEGLRLIRIFHDVSQNRLADELELAQSYLSELESGKKLPTLPILERYSHRFDIPVSSILFFSESIENQSFSERTRAVVSKKIVKLLDFIAQRAAVDE